MAKSLKKLQAENKKLQEKISSKSELLKLEQERVRLSRQNKVLLKQLKRSPTDKAVRRTLGNVGKGAFIVGKSIGRGLIRYGRFLDERQQQLEGRSRKLKKVVKKKSKVKVRRRSRRR